MTAPSSTGMGSILGQSSRLLSTCVVQVALDFTLTAFQTNLLLERLAYHNNVEICIAGETSRCDSPHEGALLSKVLKQAHNLELVKLGLALLWSLGRCLPGSNLRAPWQLRYWISRTKLLDRLCDVWQSFFSQTRPLSKLLPKRCEV